MNKIYSRLAFTNIKNNKTLYMPYIISGMVMIAMFYVMMFLNNSKGLGKVPGAEILVDIMGLGCGIIAIFSYIFLFYTNSFIIKRRKKEVGIYNILGMEKRHIAKVLQHTKGNKTEASRLLKIGLTTLYRKIEEYGI